MKEFTNLKYIKANATLSKEEEQTLFDRYRRFGDKKARERLVLSNIPFVIKMAVKYRINKHSHSHLEYADLINEGIIGLLRAIEAYNPSRNLKFISYAVWWIRSYQDKAFYDSLIIKLPQYKRKEIDYSVVSVDSLIPYTELKVGDTIKDTKEINPDVKLSLKNKIDHHLTVLNEKETRIITQFFGINKDNTSFSLQDIGNQFNVSRERIRQIKDTALGKMKKRKEFLERMEVLA
jgi:RNA polymerase primary sigma factor